MRRFFFCLVIAGSALSGCFERGQPDAETQFFRDFSLNKMVEQVAPPEIKGATGIEGFTPLKTSRRKGFSYEYTIGGGEGVKFDEVDFIMKLKAETERAADDTGARRHGGGSNNGEAFYFNYSNGEHEGWVEVVGARMEGGRYKVWGVIIERTGDEEE